MPQNVTIYGAFICSFCGQPLHAFTSSIGAHTVKCTNPDCPNTGVQYYPPSVTINEYP